MNDSIPPEVLSALTRFDSATVANAIEHFNVRDPVTGYASLELRCQFPEYGSMVGYAVTCTGTTTGLGNSRPQRLGDVLDMIWAAPKPTVLVIQDVGDDRLRSCYIGDMFSTAMQKMGAVGAVTDAGFRDRDGIARRSPGFQVFSPGTVVAHGHGVYIEFNVPVSVCGLPVNPGDLLHGDANGLVSVPNSVAADVVHRAEQVLADEAEHFEYLARDDFDLKELKGRWGL